MDIFASQVPYTKPPAPTTPAQMQAKNSAKEFEAFFLFQVLELSQPEKEETVFSGGFAEEMMQHTMNEQIGKAMAEKGSFGIADHIYGQLLKMQEAQ